MAKRTGTAGGRRARAEAAREAMARAKRRERRQRWLITGIGAAVVVALGTTVGLVLAFGQSDKQSSADGIPTTPRTTAVGGTSNPPWAAPADAAGRVKTAGLPMLSSEGNVEHIHAHLDVIVNGQKVSVPADIGIDASSGSISPLHAHDTSGVIHIESPVKVAFSLGQFFTEWNVSLSADHLGGLKAGGDKLLRAYVNGKPYQGNPAAIRFAAHDEVALVYGTAAQQANPPSSYQFAAGD
jgi:hypothetical protein